MIFDRPLTREEQLRSQKALIRFNLLNGFSYMSLGETVIILFAVKIACPNALIAALGAMFYFAYLLMPLGKWMTSRVGAVRSQADFWTYRNLAGLLVASAAVWEYFGLHLAAMGAILAGAFFFYGFRAAGAVMGMPIIGEITRESDRARFLAANSSGFQLTSLAALLLVTCLTTWSQSVWVLTFVILAGSTVGIGSTYFLRQLSESTELRAAARRPLLAEIGHAWRNSHFRSQQFADIAVNMSAILLVPMSMLALKRGCGVSDTHALLFSLVQFGSATVMSRFAARIVEKLGPVLMIRICFCLRLLLIACWIFMPAPYWPALAAVPFFLCGSCGVVIGNAMTQYFLKALPTRSQVAGSMIWSIFGNAGAGLVGMAAASGLMKLAQHLAGDAQDGFLLYRIYFLLAFAFCAIVCLYPIFRLKKFGGAQ